MTIQSTAQPQLSVNLDLVGAIFTWIADHPEGTPEPETFQHEYIRDDIPAHIAAFVKAGEASIDESNLPTLDSEPTTNSEWSELVQITPWPVRPDVVDVAKEIAKKTWRAVCTTIGLDRALEYILKSTRGWDEGSPITWSVKKLIEILKDCLLS